MKKLSFVLVLALLAGLPALLWAQSGDTADSDYPAGRGPGRQQGMMGPGGGMMGGMMGMMDMDMMGGMGFGGGFGPGMMGLGLDIFDRAQTLIGLTDDQVARLRSLWLDFVRASATPRAGIQVARAELQALLAGRNVNLAQVETKVRDIARLRGDLDLAQARFIVQAKTLLTPEQLQRLRSLQEQFGRRFAPEGRRQGPGEDRDQDDRRRGMMGTY